MSKTVENTTERNGHINRQKRTASILAAMPHEIDLIKEKRTVVSLRAAREIQEQQKQEQELTELEEINMQIEALRKKAEAVRRKR